MAEQLEEFTFKKTNNANSSYPWDEWFDGRIWKLTCGEDFTTNVANFRSHAYNTARRRGGSLNTGQVENGLVIQFVPNDT